MRDPIFERYKDVLKAGHVAVLQGRFDDALGHYREAAAMADERALPHTSQGNVLLQLGRVDEALAAYAKALGRAPHDEAALNGRAEALLAADRRREAAEILERLAEVQARSEREPAAVITLRRALRLQETKGRRRRLLELAARLGEMVPDDAGATLAAAPESGTAAEAIVPLDEASASDDTGPLLPQAGPAEGPAATPPAGPPATGASGGTTPTLLPGPADTFEHPDPEAFLEDAERARDGGRPLEALALYVLASDAYARAGAPEAALEVCQRGLEISPDAPAVHLALARLYLARGWRERAVEKLVLLDRLLTLEPAPAARRALTALAAGHAASDPRLAALASATGGQARPAA
ncbi:MAG: tetratricopeptide repeat protein [Candidatus Limnocylindrales bacterium]